MVGLYRRQRGLVDREVGVVGALQAHPLAEQVGRLDIRDLQVSHEVFMMFLRDNNVEVPARFSTSAQHRWLALGLGSSVPTAANCSGQRQS